MTAAEVHRKAILEQADTYINRKKLTSKDIDKVKSDKTIGEELKSKIIELLMAQVEEVATGFFSWLWSIMPWSKSKTKKK
jgi:hypothetical protein